MFSNKYVILCFSDDVSGEAIPAEDLTLHPYYQSCSQFFRGKEGTSVVLGFPSVDWKNVTIGQRRGETGENLKGMKS